jgi:hypothetical protein
MTDPIEAMARAMCKKRYSKEADGAYAAIGEHWRDLATAALAALRETLVPVGWCYVNSYGECEQIEYGPLFGDPRVTPLYALPEIKP